MLRCLLNHQQDHSTVDHHPRVLSTHQMAAQLHQLLLLQNPECALPCKHRLPRDPPAGRPRHNLQSDLCIPRSHHEVACTIVIRRESRLTGQQVGQPCSMLCPHGLKVHLKYLLDLVVDAVTYCSRITCYKSYVPVTFKCYVNISPRVTKTFTDSVSSI